MITIAEIRQNYRPFENKSEANRTIHGRRIIKRPGVYLEDAGESYEIVKTDDIGVYFHGFYDGRMPYYYDNLMLDYLFEDGEVIGIAR